MKVIQNAEGEYYLVDQWGNKSFVDDQHSAVISYIEQKFQYVEQKLNEILLIMITNNKKSKGTAR